MTFSIVGFDPDNGDLGVAVASKFPCVGAVVPWAKAGIGAVATQSWANTAFGPDGLTLMEGGATAAEALDALLRDDEGRDDRQVGIVDAHGGTATFSGATCMDWAVGATGEGFAAQGNILTGADVVGELVRVFSETDGDLCDRLLAALEAGDAAGGDRRGRQSAALLVVREAGGYEGRNDRYIDLRVDDSPRPIEELQRLLDLHHDTNAFTDATFYVERGDRDRGVKIMEEATRRRVSGTAVKESEKGDAYYDLACFYSAAKMKEPALASLEKAFRLNPALIPYSLNDTDLDPLREDAGYKALVKDAAAEKK
jgi:uncharacterized Ntn-hydrolase superfamily protein